VDFSADREYALTAMAGLARRAREAGHLRPDFVLDDLILMLMANSGIRAASPAAAIAASRRFAALTIGAFRAAPEAPPLPAVPRLAPAVLIS
jgi:hypothetical protein